MGTRDFGTDLLVAKVPGQPQPISNIEGIRDVVRQTLGAAMIVDEGGQFSADNYFSATDSRHGLHFTIRGRAENVMVDIAMHMAQFQDPINLVLGKRITRNYRVTVTRHELAGGRVEQVPERAPARLVTSREVKSEIELVRYGNDVQIDTNLLASPPDFQADLNRKVDFQKAQFQQKLVELGYEALMNESQNLVHALARAIPAASPKDARREANRRYFKDCFMAFNFIRSRNPANPGHIRSEEPTNVIGKILAHVRAAATATAAPMSVMLVPAGMELQGFQREPAANFLVTGIKQNEIEPVSFPLSSIVTDPTTNLKIGIHYPLLSYDQGTRNPMAQGGTGLTQTVYIVPRGRYDGDQTGQDVEEPVSTIFKERLLDSRDTIIKAVMSSAIVAAPGPDTGEMLVAYPQTTAHSIEVAPEQMTMQMRAYLGAKVYNDANCIRIPHVHCETARMMTAKDKDFDDLMDVDLRKMMESGELIPLSMDQYALFKQKMDLQTSWDAPSRKPVVATPAVDLNGGTVIKSRGKFADGGAATEDGAATEGGAAVVATDGSSTSKKEKKKGARHA